MYQHQYSHALSPLQRRSVHLHLNIKPLFWFNAILTLVIISLISYYVLVSNILASQNYQMRMMHDEFTALVEEHSGLQQTDMNLDELAAFARSRNMVEAGEVAHFSEVSNVARR